jgi:nitric oxide reductase large subunit
LLNNLGHALFSRKKKHGLHSQASNVAASLALGRSHPNIDTELHDEQQICSIQQEIVLFIIAKFSRYIFFCDEEQDPLKQGSYRKAQTKQKITDKFLWTSMTPAPNTTCRWRAAAASPLLPWIGRSPLADGKSTNLSSGEPPPSTAVVAIALLHHILLFN